MADNFERYLDEELRRSGDTDRIEVAIRVIFVHYRARLSSYASHLLRDRPEWSDDVLMDTIVRVYEQKDRLLDQPSPVRWVFRMMYFESQDRMRIAFELGLAPQTVSNLLTLARKKVWAYLEGLTS